MITTSKPVVGFVVGVGTNIVIDTIPVHGLCQIVVDIDVTAITGAPSIVFSLLNEDADLFNGEASTGPSTAVTKPDGTTAIDTAAITATGMVRLFAPYPANCKDAVAICATNNVAATSATVTVSYTIVEVV